MITTDKNTEDDFSILSAVMEGDAIWKTATYILAFQRLFRSMVFLWMRTKLKKYDKAYRELSDENTALEAELKTAQNAGREKIANKLKYGKMEQELSELHALMDNIPPEIIAAYRRHTVGLQNER